MNHRSAAESGSVVSIWRYPVKSMIGEELPLVQVSHFGLFGDRSYALVDTINGKTASAKNPRTWPTLFSFKATFTQTEYRDETIPPIRITLPTGASVTSEQPDLDHTLSKALRREVRLMAVQQGKVKGVQAALPSSWTGRSDEYWPDMEGRDHRDKTKEFTLPTGTFFDAAPVHLLTTATLHQLRQSYPTGNFAIERFRPNIVIQPLKEMRGFVENSWTGYTLAIGEEVRLNVIGPCDRCVMTTLPQGNLPKDPGILRATLQHNDGKVGVYASVLQGGTIRSGDRIRFGS